MSGIRQDHARKRMRQRAGIGIDFDAFRSHILDNERFERLDRQRDGESWLCYSNFDKRSVYFILKDDPKTKGREIATILSKGMAMASFPHVFGSPGTHIPLKEREQKERRIHDLEIQIERLKVERELLQSEMRQQVEHAVGLSTKLGESVMKCDLLEIELQRRKSVGILNFVKQRILRIV